jgi:hypothetical protein
MNKNLLTGFLCTLTTSIANGQAADFTAQRQWDNALQYSQKIYREAIRHSQHLYNGREYFVYDSPAKDHPFFESETWQESTLTYDRQQYQDIPLLFDIYKEEVIIEQTGVSGPIKLQNEKLASFSVLNHQFIKVDQPNSGLKTGFYDLIYDGKTQFLVKRIKDRQETVAVQGVTVHFYPKTKYFLLKGGKYHAVSSKRSILQLLKEHKNALKRYLKENKINFRSNPESAIAKTSAYYDQLQQP